ncbi:hypothetical protein HanIR_Chr01g0032081 [Helianthus annuus]|nr:hypothetical protein HanIR_Chr01g0032081 [Helianthus annuus]
MMDLLYMIWCHIITSTVMLMEKMAMMEAMKTLAGIVGVKNVLKLLLMANYIGSKVDVDLKYVGAQGISLRWHFRPVNYKCVDPS